jgi:hypothetical protein
LPPTRRRLQFVLEVLQQILAGHEPGGEEISRHPIRFIACQEVVSELAMAEDVDREQALVPQPTSDVRHQLLVVFHMLEHLDRQHSIKRPGVSKRFISQVMIGRLLKPRRAHSASI